MSGASVDLSQLPLPTIVEPLDFEVILSEMLASLIERFPAFSALVESDPAFVILEVAAWRELLLRQRINDAARGLTLAHASGTDLDLIGANFNVWRLLLDAGSDTTPARYELDKDYRRRIQLSFEGFTTAGSVKSYQFHALSAHGDVKDVSVSSASPGQVTINILSRRGSGAASAELIAAVDAVLSAEDKRPLTDHVIVASAAVVVYEIRAELVLYPGPDAQVVLQAAQAAIDAYTADHRLGLDIALSAIYASLQQPGVQQVNLLEPVNNIVIASNEAAHCQRISLTIKASRNE